MSYVRRFFPLYFLLLSPVYGQPHRMQFSIHVNPGLSWFSSDVREVKSTGSLMGWGYGIAMDAFFSENYALTTGIGIESLGGNLQYKDSTAFSISNNKTIMLPPNTSVQYTIQYLTVPLGIKMKSIEIGYITYYAQAGINTHFTILARGTSNDPIPLLDKDNVSREINYFNLGYHIGGGIEYSIGGHNALLFGILYNHGFSDITKSTTDHILYHYVTAKIGFLF